MLVLRDHFSNDQVSYLFTAILLLILTFDAKKKKKKKNNNNEKKIPDGLNLIARNMTQGKLSDIIVE